MVMVGREVRCTVVIRARQDIDFSTFPTGDGEPMAETEKHRRQMANLIFNFGSLTADQPRVYVGGNMLMYYTEGYGWDHVSADVFVTFDVPRGVRQKWETWHENGRFADVVVEVTSPSTYLDDLGKKRRLYARLGVRELYLYDPEQQVQPYYRGFRLAGHDLVEMPPPVRDTYYSPLLGADLRVMGEWLRVIDPTTGLPLLLVEELEQTLHATEQQRRREIMARLAAEERERQEAQARAAAEERARQEALARTAAEERAHQEAQARAATEAALQAALAELARLRGEESTGT